ncbi:MAG: hypothetical protein KME35_09395 [Aphanocapsa sp. GSE-SYN-MK-11-07L]|jgi:hypothetical protein|nr:hypothetical protein [Aphanocapsa sp. GSE-SYN-MK-11-07L]
MTIYTPQELSTIAEAPMMVGVAVALVDMGLVSTAFEAAALSQQCRAAAQNYPNNSIIQSVFSAEALQSGQIKIEKPTIEPEDMHSGAIVEQAIAAAKAALTLLEGKATPPEIQEYKDFLYACAEAVANAAGSGPFGLSPDKVSEKEAIALSKIKTALTF